MSSRAANPVGLLEQPAATPITRPPSSETIWGATAPQLHDRFWASRRIQVLRQGRRDRVEPRAELFLLLRPSDLLAFDPEEIVRRMRWLNPPAMRIRVVDALSESYTERIESDPRGAFLRIVRSYTAETRATTQAWITSKRHLAQAWTNAPDARQAKHSVLRKCGDNHAVPTKARGRIFDAEDAEQRDAFVGELVGRWADPGRMIDGVFQYQPGVWIHESTGIDESVRFVPPVWIGASSTVDAGDLCVGPLVVEDAERPTRPLHDIDWMTSPRPTGASRPRSASAPSPAPPSAPSMSSSALPSCSPRGGSTPSSCS